MFCAHILLFKTIAAEERGCHISDSCFLLAFYCVFKNKNPYLILNNLLDAVANIDFKLSFLVYEIFEYAAQIFSLFLYYTHVFSVIL